MDRLKNNLLENKRRQTEINLSGQIMELNNQKKISVRGRKHLTLQEKIELITYFKEAKCSVRKLAKIFNVGKTQCGKIIKDEDALVKRWQCKSPEIPTKLRPGTVGYEIDRIVFEWYTGLKNINFPVSGPMIQNKALELARENGFETFKASNGWLSKFLKRHKIFFKSPAPESEANLPMTDDANNEVMFWNYEECVSGLAHLLPAYSADDVFCMVQTGLFHRALPSDTKQLYGETCSSGKLSADRCTLLFCVSMAGTKEKPVVVANISKSETAKLNSPGVQCVPEKKAWITQDTMAKWLKEMDSRISKMNRSIMMFVDSAVPRPPVQLKSIKIVYLPPVFSSENQPISQRIVQDFKILYRQQLLKHLVELRERDYGDLVLHEQSTLMMTTSKAIGWIEAAWQEVGEYAIKRGFEELDFSLLVKEGYVPCSNEISASLDDVSNLLCAVDSDVSAIDYVSVDKDLVTSFALAETVEILVDVDDVYRDNSEEEMDTRPGIVGASSPLEPRTTREPDSEPELNITSYSDALLCLRDLKLFYSFLGDSTSSSLINQLIAHNEKLVTGVKEEDSRTLPEIQIAAIKEEK